MSGTVDNIAAHYVLTSQVMQRILARDGMAWEPGTKLAEIDGWNSTKTVMALLELQNRLGVTAPRDALELISTVAELADFNHASARRDASHRAGASRGTSHFARFESLGEDCEFGLIQQRFGVMQPHLLRFSAFLGEPSERLPQLIAALQDDFADLAKPELVELRVPAREWTGAVKEYRLANTRYGWVTHTGLRVDRFDYQQAAARVGHFPETLDFMRRQFLRELGLGRRVWIWKCAPASSLDEVEQLLSALQKHGPNTLLWVRRADANFPPGTVFQVRPNFFWAFIAAPGNAWCGEWSDAAAWQQLIEAAVAVLPAPAPEAKPAPVDDGSAYKPALALLNQIVRFELAQPKLVLTVDMTPADIAGWDSLKHIDIIFLVQHRLNHCFTQAELDQTTNVGAFAALIQRWL